ncbi:baculoviral IAP repeat-containing protein 3-like [Saccostrea echinata]|uniref:baculoviral IAP repeat-containing protein 3-like n=1 Tax=Saccostrea echinata TaxID=191078 RepID=UPI002A82CF0A|nr:baculoviral IAP repeat-containing protein 3-like [Saccostrea echinata]XP_061192092.1 baculoviral IAP repeat-containing protein 3-like [Saccostrea echinata]
MDNNIEPFIKTKVKRSKSENDALQTDWGNHTAVDWKEFVAQMSKSGSHVYVSRSENPGNVNSYAVIRLLQKMDEKLDEMSNEIIKIRGSLEQAKGKASKRSANRIRGRRPYKAWNLNRENGMRSRKLTSRETQTEIEQEKYNKVSWENLVKRISFDTMNKVPGDEIKAFCRGWGGIENIKGLKAVVKDPCLGYFSEDTNVKSPKNGKDFDTLLFSLLFKNFHDGLSKVQRDMQFRPLIESSRNFEEFVEKELCSIQSSRRQEDARSISSEESPHSMNLELVRLGTFKNFPASGYISTIKLAKEGFYFTGNGDRVVCFACGSERSRWKAGDIPREIHRQISPNCPLLQTGPSNNVPIGDVPNGANTAQHTEDTTQPRSVPNRISLNTGDNQNSNQSNIQDEGAQRDRYLENVNNNASETLQESSTLNRNNTAAISNGAFNTTNSSALSNGNSQASSSSSFSSENVASAPKKTDEYKNSTKTEINTVLSRSRNIQEKINAFLRDLDPLGINFDRPKYPAYAVLATRVSSYKDWPTSLTQTPRDLATAGFLYAGYGDYTRCFFCGGGLRNWEPGDDPWTEHARWFPKCAFLRQNKGDEFVALVQIEHQEQEELEAQGAGNITPSSLHQESVPNGTSHPDVSSFSSVQSVLEMGYSLAVIKEAFNQLKATKDPQDISGEDLMDFILSKEERNNGLDIPPQIFSSRPQARGENIERNTNGQQNVNVTSQADHTMPSSDQQVPLAAANGHSVESKNEDVPRPRNQENLDSLNDILPSISLEDTKSLIEENRRLRDLRICKICLENEASIAMLPCGHLCCCPDCAPAMRKCPICRQFVKGTVRTWLA